MQNFRGAKGGSFKSGLRNTLSHRAGLFHRIWLGFVPAWGIRKKSALKSSWVSETNYQKHGWLVTGNVLLWEIVSTPLMSSDQGWTSFRKVLCQMRCYWAQLAIISTSEFGTVGKGTWRSDDKMWKQVGGIPFFISQCNRMILGPRMNRVLPEVWLSQYSSHLLSVLCWLSSADSSKKLIYWLSMEYHLKIQSSHRRVKRWFYIIIISLAITMCSCTELIQFSLLLLLKMFYF